MLIPKGKQKSEIHMWDYLLCADLFGFRLFSFIFHILGGVKWQNTSHFYSISCSLLSCTAAAGILPWKRCHKTRCCCWWRVCWDGPHRSSEQCPGCSSQLSRSLSRWDCPQMGCWSLLCLWQPSCETFLKDFKKYLYESWLNQTTTRTTSKRNLGQISAKGWKVAAANNLNLQKFHLRVERMFPRHLSTQSRGEIVPKKQNQSRFRCCSAASCSWQLCSFQDNRLSTARRGDVMWQKTPPWVQNSQNTCAFYPRIVNLTWLNAMDEM